jgi:hypothetical protein
LGSKVVGAGDIQAFAFEQLSLSFGLEQHLPAEDGVDSCGGSDISMMRVLVLFVIVVVTILSLMNNNSLVGISFHLLGVDALEDAAVLHGVIGLGVELARPFQSLVVVLLVIAATTKLLDRVDFFIIFAGALASGIVVVTPPITVVSAVAIVAPTVVVVGATTIVAVVVPTTVFTVVIMV